MIRGNKNNARQKHGISQGLQYGRLLIKTKGAHKFGGYKVAMKIMM